MIYRIHYTINGYDDYIDIKGESIEEVKQNAYREEEARGLTVEGNNLWSEKIEE